MKFETWSVSGWAPAIYGMRHPLKSYGKSDTDFTQTDDMNFRIGTNDYDLMSRLWKSGTEHRKWMRMIEVWVDITAPLYWWSEFDTYKNVVKNSTSTMHTLAAKDDLEDLDELFELDDSFDKDKLRDFYDKVVVELKDLREDYKLVRDAGSTHLCDEVRRQMKAMLPSGFKQTRMCHMSYETIAQMYAQRKNHKLPEWSDYFVHWVQTLPHSEFITGLD